MHSTRIHFPYPRWLALFLLLFCCVPAATARATAADGEREAFLVAYEEGLAAQAYLHNVRRQRIDDWHPLLLEIQPPDDGVQNYVTALASELGPWLAALERRFQVEYAEPLGLVRHKSLPVLGLLALGTRADYDGYLESAPAPRSARPTCNIDEALGVVVTYRDYQKPIRTYRADILELAAELLLRSYRADPKSAKGPAWLELGLAHDLAYQDSPKPLEPGETQLDPHAVAYVSYYDKFASLSQSYLHPLAELVLYPDLATALATVQKRARPMGFAYEAPLAQELFAAQAYLLVHALHDPQAPESRAWLGRALVKGLAGKGWEQELAKAPGGVEWEAFESNHSGWIAQQAATIHWSRGVATPAQGEVQAGAAGAGGSETAGAEEALAPADPSALALTVGDCDAWIARALKRALEGELEQAIDDLAALDVGSVPRKRVAQVEGEKRRLKSLLALREVVLGDLVASQKPFKLERDGEKLSLRLVAIEGSTVRCEEARGGASELALTDFTPERFLPYAGKETLTRMGTWMVSWPAVLRGDAKAVKALRGDDPDVVGLREGASELYPLCREVGEAAILLDRLEKGYASAASEGGEAWLADLAQLLREHGQVAVVGTRRAALRACALELLGQIDQGERAIEHIGAKTVEDLGGGRLRLLYTFDSANELLDFRGGNAFLEEWLTTSVGPKLARERYESKVADGWLQVSGQKELRHRIDFAPPLELRWRYRMDYLPGKANQALTFLVGCCWGSSGEMIVAEQSGWVVLYRGGGATDVPSSAGRSFFDGKVYQLELHYDGEQVESLRDGKPLASAAAKGYGAGGIFLLFNSDMIVRVDELEIVGTPTSEGLQEARRIARDRRLAELGLAD